MAGACGAGSIQAVLRVKSATPTKRDILDRRWGIVGWKTGLEPATSASTVRRSAIELHPPQVGKSIAKAASKCKS